MSAFTESQHNMVLGWMSEVPDLADIMLLPDSEKMFQAVWVLLDAGKRQQAVELILGKTKDNLLHGYDFHVQAIIDVLVGSCSKNELLEAAKTITHHSSKPDKANGDKVIFLSSTDYLFIPAKIISMVASYIQN